MVVRFEVKLFLNYRMKENLDKIAKEQKLTNTNYQVIIPSSYKP